MLTIGGDQLAGMCSICQAKNNAKVAAIRFHVSLPSLPDRPNHPKDFVFPR